MKKQTNKAIRAHLLRNVFTLFALFAVCMIPIAVAQRAGHKPFVAEGVCPTPWQLVADMPVEVVGAAGASDGILSYHAGGGNFTSGTLDLFNSYNPATDTWTALEHMPQAAAAASAVYYPPTNRIYVFGGVNLESGVVYDVTQIYDIASNTWTAGTNMPDVRFAMAAGYNSANDRIYLVSGYNTYSVSSAQSDTWEYDPVAETFTSKADFPHPAGGVAAGVINGHLYVAGGRDAANVVLTLTWDYDIAADTWTQRTDMPAGENYAPGSAVALDNLWVFGGDNATIPPPPGSDSAKAVFGSTTTLFPRPVVKNGVPIPDTVNTGRRYDPVSDTWFIAPDIPNMNVPRSYPSGAAINNKLIAAGGFDGNIFVPSAEVLDACIPGQRPNPTPRSRPTPRPRP